MTASRIAWSILVPFCVVLAALAVVVMIRENTGSAAPAEESAVPTVKMENLSFAPATLTVAQGTDVLFDNADVAPHTVTADEGSTDSGLLDPGKTFSLRVSESFSYHCNVHPSMKAEIRLEG